MIVFRYLARDVLVTTVVVAAILFLIITSSRLIGYLGDTASGELSSSVILELVAYRSPKVLELLLPLGLFLGVLLSYGRLYLESEMVVLKACGIGRLRIVAFTMGPALLISLLVGVVSLYLTPAGIYEAKRVAAEQRNRSDLDMLVPGVFQTQKNKNQVSYARQLDEQGHLNDLFVSGSDTQGNPYVLVAEEAEQRFIENQGRFLVFKDGHRYVFPDKGLGLQELSYNEYALKIDEPVIRNRINHLDAIPTSALLGSDRSDYISRLHWRLSLPFLPLIVILLAIPLAKTSPRQGRYAKLIPAILLYQFYVAGLTGARSLIEQGDVGVWFIWGVHIIAATFGISMIVFEGATERFFNRLPKLPAFSRTRRGTF